MTVKEFINELLDCDMNKEVSLEYPTARNYETGNYYNYEEAERFKIYDCEHGVIIGVDDN